MSNKKEPITNIQNRSLCIYMWHTNSLNVK